MRVYVHMYIHMYPRTIVGGIVNEWQKKNRKKYKLINIKYAIKI